MPSRPRSIVRTLRRFGAPVGGNRPPERSRAPRVPWFPPSWVRLFDSLGVDLVLDVGANTGQYGRSIRGAGYRGPIISFEPLSSARTALEEVAAGDPAWSVRPYALGETDGTAALRVAGNSVSSSTLEMLERHRRSAPRSAYIGSEEVPCRRLDGLASDVLDGAERPFLKVDVQGAELNVLRGAGPSIERYCGLQLELSVVPLYAGAPLYQNVLAFVTHAGFELAGVRQGFTDLKNGQMLQFDGVFVRGGLFA